MPASLRALALPFVVSILLPSCAQGTPAYELVSSPVPPRGHRETRRRVCRSRRREWNKVHRCATWRTFARVSGRRANARPRRARRIGFGGATTGGAFRRPSAPGGNCAHGRAARLLRGRRGDSADVLDPRWRRDPGLRRLRVAGLALFASERIIERAVRRSTSSRTRCTGTAGRAACRSSRRGCRAARATSRRCSLWGA
jgi:hypothetical protein